MCRFPEVESVYLNMPNIHFLPVNLPTVGVTVIFETLNSTWILSLGFQKSVRLCFPVHDWSSPIGLSRCHSPKVLCQSVLEVVSYTDNRSSPSRLVSSTCWNESFFLQKAEGCLCSRCAMTMDRRLSNCCCPCAVREWRLFTHWRTPWFNWGPAQQERRLTWSQIVKSSAMIRYGFQDILLVSGATVTCQKRWFNLPTGVCK